MQHNLLQFTLIPLLMLLVLVSAAQVEYRDTVVVWSHFDYALDENNGMDYYSTQNIVQEGYPGIVLENNYVRLVVLPEFGARILSFYYKPSGHEQFYTNPVGAPYGMNEGNFYYDWLMVMGGVFPTFPEPEHGKTWFLPWQWEIIEASEEVVSLRMQLQDTIFFPGHPGKFNNGVTDIRCTCTLSLRKGKTSFELSYTLQNTKPETIPFEYWTCTTLAPGSEAGNTFTPASSEIVVPLEHVFLKDDWWSWMGQAEEPAFELGSHVFEYKNLAIYDNWEDMGIAYAYPMLEAPYYGVINHGNAEGVFRVSDNAGVTKGMKFWTWGAEQGLNADPENFYDVARPYIELWSGLSTQFFEDAYILPNESISFTETYLPTMSMDAVSLVNESGAIHLDHTKDQTEKFTTEVFTTSPEASFDLDVTLYGGTTVNLYSGSFISEAAQSKEYSFYVDDFSIADGDYDLVARVYDPEGELVMESSLPVTVPYQSQGIGLANQSMPKLTRVSDNIYRLEFTEAGTRDLRVISINGQLVDARSVQGGEAYIRIEKPGIYIVQVLDRGSAYALKITIG